MSAFKVNNTPDDNRTPKTKSIFGGLSLQSGLIGLALVAFASVIAYKVLDRFKTEEAIVKPEKVVECQTVLPEVVDKANEPVEVKAQTKAKATRRPSGLRIKNDCDNAPLNEPEPQSDSVNSITKYAKLAADLGNVAPENSLEHIYNIADIRPEFPGGHVALLSWLKENLKYPKELRETAVEGTVTIGFVVEADGSITNICIKRGLPKGSASLLNEEALRVVKLMPKWIPGKFQGREVRVNQTIPVRFKVSE